MRPDQVVVLAPAGEFLAGIFECKEHFHIQALIPQSAVEALDEAVLHP